jgi:hypothetical protein
MSARARIRRRTAPGTGTWRLEYQQQRLRFSACFAACLAYGLAPCFSACFGDSVDLVVALVVVALADGRGHQDRLPSGADRLGPPTHRDIIGFALFGFRSAMVAAGPVRPAASWLLVFGALSLASRG